MTHNFYFAVYIYLQGHGLPTCWSFCGYNMLYFLWGFQECFETCATNGIKTQSVITFKGS